MTQTKHIEVWLDRTSEPGEAYWIVSLEDGLGSTTIASFPGTDEGYGLAADRAKAEAGKRGLEIRETDAL